jgi:hypothetical protein
MKTAVDQLIEKMSLKDVCKYSKELAEAKEMEKEREKSIFSIAYRMTPIEFGKEYCELEFEKFNKTFNQQEQ